ncbi:MAG: FixH family protein [Pseudomonadota bacterium]
MQRELTGWHVLGIFVVGFGIIIAVNLTLAFNAVSTFPGLEVKNSYIASQSFDDRRAAQVALGWRAEASYDGATLRLVLRDDYGPVQAEVLEATLGRATHVAEDRDPGLVWDGAGYSAPADLNTGSWQLRLKAEAADGTMFEQRVPIWVRTQ